MRSAGKINPKAITHKLTFSAMMVAAAFALSYIESLIPLNLGIPGIKLGLANIAVLASLCLYGPSAALPVMIVKVLLSAASFSPASSFIFSLTGGLLSFAAMCVLRRLNFAVTTVSIGGAVAHNIGQLAAAVLLAGTKGFILYLPVLIIAGIITGAINGILTSLILSRVKNTYRNLPN